MRTRRCAPAAVAIVVVLGACGPAAAATFCVQAPNCSGTPEATVQAALAAADSNGTGLDEVLVGPGFYAEGALLAVNPVEVDGAGQGQTFITRAGAVSGDKVLTTQHAASSVSDLTVQLPPVSNVT